MNLKQMIRESLKRKHPDYNKARTANRDTQFLTGLLRQEPEITRRKGMTRKQARELLKEWNEHDNP